MCLTEPGASTVARLLASQLQGSSHNCLLSVRVTACTNMALDIELRAMFAWKNV